MIRFAPVTSFVCRDLFAPPNSISLGFGIAARAAVPEATVNEYGDALDGEHQIRTTGERTGSCGVPNSQLLDDAQHPSLGLGSADGHSTHTLRYLAGRLEWSTGGGHVKQITRAPASAVTETVT